MKKVLSASLLAILSASLVACGGSGGSSTSNQSTQSQISQQNQSNESNLENNTADNNSTTNSNTQQKYEEMLAQSKIAVVPELLLPETKGSQIDAFIFAGVAGKLSDNNYLSSIEQPKPYIANFAICNSNSTCYDNATGKDLLTGQVQFEIQPTKDGKLSVENAKLLQFNKSNFNLQSSPYRVSTSQIITELTGSIQEVSAEKRSFKLSLSTTDNSLVINDLIIAFSAGGGWFTSVSDGVFMSGVRQSAPDNHEIPTDVFTEFKQTNSQGIAFTDKFKGNTGTYDFTINDSPSDLKDFVLDTKSGNFVQVADGTLLYGFKESNDLVTKTAGVFVIDPTATFASGYHKSYPAFTTNVNVILQKN